MKGKYIILLKFYNKYWQPYFEIGGKVHCFDYVYAKNLYDKLCKNFNTNQWLLIKIDELYINEDKFLYIKEDNYENI